MAEPAPTVLDTLRQLTGRGDAVQATDRELLERFAARRDEGAFRALLERHGPMVRGVCLRVTLDDHEADDAFQATFLVLARKASKVAWRESVGGWLHEVAYRIANKARAAAARARAIVQRLTTQRLTTQRFTQRESGAVSDADSLTEAERQELRAVLDAELARLPEKYRAPLVLCYLEERSNEEAARQLGWTKGTVSGRLSRARELLRGRLARRGLALGSAALAGVLPASAASAAVPSSLLDGTLQAAMLYAAGPAGAASAVSAHVLAMTQGALHAMFISKLKIALSVLLAVSVLGAGAAVLAYRAFAADRPDRPAAQQNPKTPERPAAAEPKTDLEKLQGLWHIVAVESEGKNATKEELEERLFRKLLIKGNWFMAFDGDFGPGALIKIDPAKKPKTIDWYTEERIVENGVRREREVLTGVGIYELDGDTLKIARVDAEQDPPGLKPVERKLTRPADFTTKAKTPGDVVVYRRGEPPAVPDKKTPPEIVEAQVTLHMGRDGVFEPGKSQEKTVKDKAMLAKLASCFPAMGRGRKTNIFGGWTPRVTIEFRGAKGESLKVVSTWTNWSEGAGDWSVKGNLMKHAGELFDVPRLIDQGRLLDPWQVVAFEEGGKKHDPKRVTFAVDEYDFDVEVDGKTAFGADDYTLDPSKTPRQIDMRRRNGDLEKYVQGIYAFEGDTLKICLDTSLTARPTEFKIRAARPGDILLVLQKPRPEMDDALKDAFESACQKVGKLEANHPVLRGISQAKRQVTRDAKGVKEATWSFSQNVVATGKPPRAAEDPTQPHFELNVSLWRGEPSQQPPANMRHFKVGGEHYYLIVTVGGNDARLDNEVRRIFEMAFSRWTGRMPP
jgi:RNA polymerase sigma factor (sigma-70 family)